MNLDIWLSVGTYVFLVLLFLIIYFKDVESSKKFERFERAIEDLNHQNHQLRHALNAKDEMQKEALQAMKLDFSVKIENEINAKFNPFINSLKDIENVICDFQTDQQERIVKLEQSSRNIPSVTSHEKQVIHAYQNGKSLHEIAKDLRIGLGEIEFILKMNHLL